MINNTDFDKIKERYSDFWSLKNNTPILHITAPKNDYVKKQIKKPSSIEECWLNTEYVIEKTREDMKSTYYGGDAYPYVMPNLGPDIFGTMLGCNLEFGETTSWAIHCVDDWYTYPEFSYDENNRWWKKIISLTEAFLQDSNKDYYVGITDMHPGLDALVSLRGSQNLCIDLYDCPEEINRRIKSINPIYEKCMNQLFELTSKYQTHNTHWMSALHNKRWYNISCDFISLISQDMFEEFCTPQINLELELYDKTIFHLDGPLALKHIDSILSFKKLTGVQWVYGAGSPTASHWIDLLQKIQKSGKCIHVDIVAEDIDALLKNLDPSGVMFCAYPKTEDEAKFIENKIKKYYC